MERKMHTEDEEGLARELSRVQADLLACATEVDSAIEGDTKVRSGQLEAAYAQLEAYARDLRAMVDAERRRRRQLELAHFDTLLRLARACELRDNETGHHIVRIGHYARAMARHLGQSDTDQKTIFAAAQVHDIGKIGISDLLLLKQGALTNEEWATMKTHPIIGVSLLEGGSSPVMRAARDIALTHHERWDGSGYPYGLKGEQIPLAGRITMIADIYDALRSPRPYKPGFEHEKAYDIIVNGDGRTMPCHFDPSLLDVFKAIHTKFDVIYTNVTATPFNSLAHQEA